MARKKEGKIVRFGTSACHDCQTHVSKILVFDTGTTDTRVSNTCATRRACIAIKRLFATITDIFNTKTIEERDWEERGFLVRVDVLLEGVSRKHAFMPFRLSSKQRNCQRQ